MGGVYRGKAQEGYGQGIGKTSWFTVKVSW